MESSKNRPNLSGILSWILSILGLFLAFIFLFISKVGALGVLLSSLIILPPVRKTYLSKFPLRLRFAYIISTVLFISSFIYSVATYKVDFDSSVKRSQPTELSFASDKPETTINYKCAGIIKEITLNNEKVSEEIKDKICSDGYSLQLKDGTNQVKLTLTDGEKTLQEELNISFDEQGYNQKIEAERKQKEEEDRIEAQKKADEEARLKAEQEAKDKEEAERIRAEKEKKKAEEQRQKEEQAKREAEEKAKLEAQINPKPIVISGSGDSITAKKALKTGYALVKITYSGSSNIIVKSHSESKSEKLLVNEIGSYSGTTFLEITKDEKYYFEVTASGSWKISITQPTATTLNAPLNLSGTGDTVKLINFKKDNYIVKLSYKGTSNFIVHFIDPYSYFDFGSLIANEIGKYSGTKLIEPSKDGMYYLVIEAQGSWTANISKQ